MHETLRPAVGYGLFTRELSNDRTLNQTNFVYTRRERQLGSLTFSTDELNNSRAISQGSIM